MCGICGFSGENNKKLLVAMTNALEHRGPDGNGFFEDRQISLGHRRLKIIDLSDNGKQPMNNEDGTVWVVFNGEIYNYKMLRTKLIQAGHSFCSETDTEVIVHGYEEWGENCVNYFDGMFAFALWNSKEKKLFLARDPMGVKPLYYSVIGNEIFFGSEIKALLENPEVPRKLNKKAVSQLLNFRTVLSNQTMFEEVFKVLPGTFLTWKDNKKTEKKYWDLNFSRTKVNEKKVFSQTLDLITKAVQKRLVSDVPVGAFLSGGVDSSAITAIMSNMTDNLQTFTVGFSGQDGELKHASSIAEVFGTDHNEVIVETQKMTEVLPKLLWHMDEPMADIAFVPLYFLTKSARKKITVALLGEGADEVFAGYERYRKTLGFNSYLPKKIAAKNYIQTDLAFRENETRAVLAGKNKVSAVMPVVKDYFAKGNFLDNALFFDSKEMLPNYQLARVDRVTMSCGLEARVPFLDKKLVNWGFNLDPSFKLFGKTGKYVVKKSLKELLPKKVLQERKRIFFIPLKQWFKESLGCFVEGLLEKKTVEKRGLFDYKDIKRKLFLQKHGVFENRFANQLLMLSMIELWQRTFIDREKVPKGGLKMRDLQ